MHLWDYIGTLTILYGALNYALMSLPGDAWRRVVLIAPEVDSLIRDPADRSRLARLVAKGLRLELQLCISALAAVGGFVIAIVEARSHGVVLSSIVVYALSLASALFLGVNVVLWMLYGLRYLFVFSRLTSVRLDEVDPGATPALSDMYPLIARVQWYATIGLLLAILPLALRYVLAAQTHTLTVALIAAAIAAFIVVLLVYVLPSRFMREVREREKRRLLFELRRSLPSTLTGLDRGDVELVGECLAIYEQVRRQPTGGFDRTVLASLIVAMVTVAAAFAPLLFGAGALR